MQPISQGCIAWWCCVLTHWGQNGHINKLRVKAGTARYCNPRPGSSSIPLAFKLWPSWSLVYCAKDFGQIAYSNAICFYLYSVYILSWAPTKRPSLSVFLQYLRGAQVHRGPDRLPCILASADGSTKRSTWRPPTIHHNHNWDTLVVALPTRGQDSTISTEPSHEETAATTETHCHHFYDYTLP